MDERLKKALDFSNYMQTLNNQKRLLLEKYQEDLICFYNGSQFTITRELITFVNAMISTNQSDIVIIDDNNIPCMIEDAENFYVDIIDTYTAASTNYHSAYTTLKTNRSVGKLVNYD